MSIFISSDPITTVSPLSPLNPIISLFPKKDVKRDLLIKSLATQKPILIPPSSPLETVVVTPDSLSFTDSIVIDPLSNSLLTDTPFSASINLNYSQPMFSFYEDLNNDPEIHQKLTKYFYYKILDKWLFDDLIDLLNYLTIEGNKIKLGSYKKSNTTSNSEIKKKVDYFEKYILKKRHVYKILKQFVKRTGTRWVDLPKNEYYLIQVFENKLKKIIKQMLK